MNLAGCQFDIVWEDKSASIAKAQTLLRNANLPKGALVALPEMFSTGFSMNAEAISEGEERVAERFLAETAQELGVYLLGGVVVMGADGKGRNQSVVYSPEGAEIARYSKIFPFSPGGESDAYAAGDEIVLFDWQGMKAALFICYDLRFPEIFRCAAAKGAEIYFVIASWPQTRTHHWMALLLARAIENQAYVVGVNRCGTDPKFGYTGRSQIIHPLGRVLADAGEGEAVIQAAISAEELRAVREKLPFLRDIRAEWLPKQG